MILDNSYLEYLFQSTRWGIERDVTTADRIVKLTEETGEVAEAYISWSRFKINGTPTKRESDIADEAADVVHAALVLIVSLGFDPIDMLERQQAKVQERYKVLDASA